MAKSYSSYTDYRNFRDHCETTIPVPLDYSKVMDAALYDEEGDLADESMKVITKEFVRMYDYLTKIRIEDNTEVDPKIGEIDVLHEMCLYMWNHHMPFQIKDYWMLLVQVKLGKNFDINLDFQKERFCVYSPSKNDDLDIELLCERIIVFVLGELDSNGPCLTYTLIKGILKYGSESELESFSKELWRNISYPIINLVIYNLMGLKFKSPHAREKRDMLLWHLKTEATGVFNTITDTFLQITRPRFIPSSTLRRK